MTITLWLTIAIALFALLASYVDMFARWRDSRKKAIKATINFVVFLIAVTVTVIGYRRSTSSEHVSRAAGTVGRDASSSGAFGVSVGTNYVGASTLEAAFGIPVHLALDANFQLRISYELLDEQGNRIAYLRDNEWWGVHDPYDRNFNDEMFEIVNLNEERPILQIRRRGNRAVIQGEFRARDGRILLVDSARIRFGPDPKFRMCSWFTYPSTLHPGEVNQECRPPDLPTGELPEWWR